MYWEYHSFIAFPHETWIIKENQWSIDDKPDFCREDIETLHRINAKKILGLAELYYRSVGRKDTKCMAKKLLLIYLLMYCLNREPSLKS